MTDKFLCPQCEKGHLMASTWDDDFRHGDHTVHVDGLECYVCDQCDADPVYTDQIRRNQRRIADAKRSADGMLTGSDVRAVRDSLGINQQQAAMLFGGGSNAFSKYERGDVLQSASMDRLLKAAAVVPGVFEFLQSEAGICPSHVTVYQGGKDVEMKQDSFSSRSVQGHAVEVMHSGWKQSEAEVA